MNQNKNRKTVTLRDIALACHVSVNTVSHALSDKSDISAETKRIINQTAKEMGYIRNRTATSLRFQKTRTITLIISDISNPLFAIMAKEIEHELRKQDYTLFIMNTESNAHMEYKAVVSAIENAADGIIICPNQIDTDALELMEKRGIPYILMGRRFPDKPIDYVIWNDQQGGYLATEHLIQRGHRRILFVGEAPYISSTAERLAGYQEALAEHNISYDPALVYTGDLTNTGIHNMIKQQIGQENPFTAIFAFSDFVACDILSVMHKLTPEKKVDVIGFDDIQSSVSFPLNISSVNTPKEQMAKALVEAILNKIRQGEDSAPCHKVIDTSLMLR